MLTWFDCTLTAVKNIYNFICDLIAVVLTVSVIVIVQIV